MRGLSVLGALAGCSFSIQPGDIAVGDDGGSGSEGVIADASIDAAPLPVGPFSNIMPLTPLNTLGGEDDPTLTGDLLEIYFDRGGDIYVSARASVADPWPAAVAMTALNTAFSETTTEITDDGLELYFSSNRSGSAGGLDIYVSTRPNRNAAFATPTRVAELATLTDDVTPTVIGGGLVMYLSSLRVGGAGGYDLWRSTRADRTSAWSAPTFVTGVATAGTETEPWVDPLETTLYMSTDGLGGRDLYLSTRTDPSAAWGSRVAVTELNSAGSEEDPWLSPDGHTMIFASNRGTSYDLYMATR